jgi:pyruvate carboxylase
VHISEAICITVIDGLGDKVKARTVALQNGVPVVPGTPGAIASYDLAVCIYSQFPTCTSSHACHRQAEFIKEHGFPVIIKVFGVICV